MCTRKHRSSPCKQVLAAPERNRSRSHEAQFRPKDLVYADLHAKPLPFLLSFGLSQMLFLHIQPLGAAKEWEQALAGGHGQDVGLGCCLLPKESTAPFPNIGWQPGENFSFEQLQNCRSTKCDQGNHHRRRGALTLLRKPPILAHTSPPACQTRVHRIASGSQLFPLWFLLLQFLHTITLFISKGSSPKKTRTLKTTENYNLAESCSA